MLLNVDLKFDQFRMTKGDKNNTNIRLYVSLSKLGRNKVVVERHLLSSQYWHMALDIVSFKKYLSSCVFERVDFESSYYDYADISSQSRVTAAVLRQYLPVGIQYFIDLYVIGDKCFISVKGK